MLSFPDFSVFQIRYKPIIHGDKEKICRNAVEMTKNKIPEKALTDSDRRASFCFLPSERNNLSWDPVRYTGKIFSFLKKILDFSLAICYIIAQ